MITKYATQCCALAHLSMSSDTTEAEIQEFIDNLRIEADSQEWYGTEYDAGGQRSVFTITTPEEKELEKNLRNQGFEIINVFYRRKGYPEGSLTMWSLNW